MKKLLLLLITLLCASTAARAADSVPNCRNMKRDITALSCTIYYEARGATYVDKLGISFVTINRSKMQGNKSLAKVIKQKGQYSFMQRKNLVPKEQEAWDEANQIAKQMIKLTKDHVMYKVLDFTQGATYYHDRSISNPWNFTMTLKTANLVFYKDSYATN